MRGSAGSIALFCALFGLECNTASAQLKLPMGEAVRSLSGQFVIEPRDNAAPPASAARLAMGNDRKNVRLEPALLAISCERVKQLLFRQIQAVPATWQGRIFLALYPADSPDDSITVTSFHFADGWQYRVELPDLVERDRYVRTMVQVLLLELANRGAGDRAAEIPLWLTEGLTRRLLASSEIEIILPPPRATVNGLWFATASLNARKTNAVELARHDLAARVPLTFDQLSWPTEDALNGDTGEMFRDSSELFVAEVLQMRDGAACLRAMLADLPQHYNWQFAFLKAFQAHFGRLVDVEKWWVLQSAQFTARDLDHTWTLAESWKKLDDTLRAAAEVRASTNELPTHAEVPLQTILREWDAQRLTDTLQAKLRELRILNAGIARPLSGLVAGYYSVIDRYLQQRARAGAFGAMNAQQTAEQSASAQALVELDMLDTQRETLRSSLKPVLAPPDPPAAVRAR